MSKEIAKGTRGITNHTFNSPEKVAELNARKLTALQEQVGYLPAQIKDVSDKIEAIAGKETKTSGELRLKAMYETKKENLERMLSNANDQITELENIAKGKKPSVLSKVVKVFKKKK